MKYVITGIIAFLTLNLGAQDVDGKRMKRDIEVAEKVIESLLEEDGSDSFFASPGGQVEGTYLDGYGVLFTIRRSTWNIIDRQHAVVVEPQRAEAPPAPRSDRRTPARIEGSEMGADEMKQLAEEFFAEYGYLLSQLPDDEHICLKYTPGRGGIRVGGISINRGSDTQQRYTAVIKKSVVESFQKGSIDRKTLAERIDFSETTAEEGISNRKLVLLSSIIERLYQRDLSDGFIMVGRGRIEEITGLGAIFYYTFSDRGMGGMLWHSSPEGLILETPSGGRLYTPLGEFEEIEEDEEDTEYEGPDFDDFLEEFSRSVVEYGSTVNNLPAGEVLTFQLRFPRCDECDDRPEQVKIVAKQSVLEGYRAGRLSLEDAMDQLQISR